VEDGEGSAAADLPSVVRARSGQPRSSTADMTSAVRIRPPSSFELVSTPPRFQREELRQVRTADRQHGERSGSDKPSFEPISSTRLSMKSRRNVTQRRSKDRPRDSIGTSLPVSKLLARLPQPRPMDLAYENEVAEVVQSRPKDLAYEDEVVDDVVEALPRHLQSSETSPMYDIFSSQKKNAASVSLSPEITVPVPKVRMAKLPDFTRRQIPTEYESPKLHQQLRKLWITKKALEEDMVDADEAGEEGKYHIYAEQHDSATFWRF
jgi:hypothetical protein